MLNTPQNWGAGGAYKTYAATRDEFLQAVLLTLNSFTVENYDAGPTTQEPCGATAWGRGCLYITGGVIQGTRGAVGTTAGTGYIKAYSYDQCAFQTPPPYFPTTGRFFRNRYYEIDPVGLQRRRPVHRPDSEPLTGRPATPGRRCPAVAAPARRVSRRGAQRAGSSSSRATARLRCGITIEPPTTSATANAS